MAVNALIEIGHLRIAVPPFYGVATALGGWLFGVGMVLAVDCAGAVLFRAGEGKLDYVLASVAYGVGTWAGMNWAAVPVRRALGDSGAGLTAHRGMFLHQPLVLIILAGAIVFWVSRGPRRPHLNGWDWRWRGFPLGVVGIAAWVVLPWPGILPGWPHRRGRIDWRRSC
ncbi:MAG TPA: YeeE/YedE thiosulfate transporter family protein [Candidatus Baltobacteraceae bacterium]|nr:YeeE/YedE thiosulfate transporter family protein [Candidatus Baltobacteraceae bacterium]